MVAAGDATSNPEGRGNVLRLQKYAGNEDHAGVTLRNPAPIRLETIHSLRADAVALVDDVWASYQTRRPHDQDLYDDFDGHGGYRAADASHLAVAGRLSADLWHGSGRVTWASELTTAAQDHGKVLVLDAGSDTNDGVFLNNPEVISIGEVRSFAADVLIPASSNPRDFGVDMQVSANLADLDDPSWRTWFGFGADRQGSLQIWGCWRLVGADTQTCRNVDARPDTWYSLRIDLVPIGRGVRAELYVNDLLLQSGLTDPMGLLLDATNFDWGPQRQIYVWTPEEGGSGTVLVDDVYATYHRMTLGSITPSTLLQGETSEVTLTGEGFREGAVPYSKPWGVSFVDISVVDGKTLTATALVNDLARPGPRTVVFGQCGYQDEHEQVIVGYSNSLEFTIVDNDQLQPAPLAYGLYEDYEDPTREGPQTGAIWDPTTSCGAGRSRLVYSSEAHPETFPTFTQENGTLTVWVGYDAENGNWQGVRFAEPEGFYEKRRNMFRLARSVTASYVIPSGYTEWERVGLGFGAWYQTEEPYDRPRWGFSLWLDPEQSDGAVVNYWVSLWGDTIPWSTEVHRRLIVEEFSYDVPVSLRYDVLVWGDDGLAFDIFVNDTMRARVFPENSDFLLNHADWGNFEDIAWGGPLRGLMPGKALEDPGLTYFIDDIKGVFPMIHPVLNASSRHSTAGNRITFDTDPVNDFHLYLEDPGLHTGHIRCYQKLYHDVFRIEGDHWRLLNTITQATGSPNRYTFDHAAGTVGDQYVIITRFTKGWQSEPVIVTAR